VAELRTVRGPYLNVAGYPRAPASIRMHLPTSRRGELRLGQTGTEVNQTDAIVGLNEQIPTVVKDTKYYSANANTKCWPEKKRKPYTRHRNHPLVV
jgi:hypothetical protein